VTIYLDILLLFTFLCNGAILYLVIYVMKQKRPIRYLFFGTILASIYVPIIIYFPNSFFNTVIGKVIYSIVIILVTIGRTSLSRLLKTIITFYVISFVTGGFLLSIHYMIAQSKRTFFDTLLLYTRNIYGDEISLLLLVLGFPFILWLIKIWSDKFILDSFKVKQSYKVKVFWNDSLYETEAFLDSGNELVDPLTNRPVIICDSTFMRKFFHEEDWRQIEKAITERNITIIPQPFIKSFHTIPYTTVAGEDQLLAIKPDKLEIITDQFRICTKRVFIGIQLGRLAIGEYHCLLHPQIVTLEKVEPVLS